MTCDSNVTMKADLRIVHVLWAIAGKHARQWCYPSQETILRNLLKYHGVQMDRRTLCRHMAGLEKLGYITRIKRHSRARDGSLWLKSTVYTLLSPAFTLIDTLRRALENLSTVIVNKFHQYAVPKVAQKARLESVIMNYQHQRNRKRFRW